VTPDRRKKPPRRRPPALPQVRTGPSPDDPHDIVYFQRHKADDPSGSTPAREFLELCPTGCERSSAPC